MRPVSDHPFDKIEARRTALENPSTNKDCAPYFTFGQTQLYNIYFNSTYLWQNVNKNL